MILISWLGTLISFAAAIGYMWVALLPRLGPRPLHWLGTLSWPRRLLAFTGWLLAAFNFRRRPGLSRFLPLALSTLFNGVANVMTAARIFVPLHRPPHQPGPEADLGNKAVVLGVVVGETAVAWPFTSLVPRHLIHDVVGQMPVLAAY